MHIKISESSWHSWLISKKDYMPNDLPSLSKSILLHMIIFNFSCGTILRHWRYQRIRYTWQLRHHEMPYSIICCRFCKCSIMAHRSKWNFLSRIYGRYFKNIRMRVKEIMQALFKQYIVWDIVEVLLENVFVQQNKSVGRFIFKNRRFF